MYSPFRRSVHHSFIPRTPRSGAPFIIFYYALPIPALRSSFSFIPRTLPGLEAFATYLPDVDAVRRDHRSGGSRKWATLAAALHRETAAFMTIPTEDAPRRVRRRHAVLRPAHLSAALVPNALLARVTADDKHFAHADAVAEMGLESCLAVCPMPVVLDCIRVVLERAARPDGGDSGGDGGEGKGAAAEDGSGGGEGVAARRRSNKPKKRMGARRGDGRGGGEGCGVLSNELLLDVWRYLAAEHAALRSQLHRPPSSHGAHGGRDNDARVSLRLLVEALVGGPADAALEEEGSAERPALPPLRIFPVVGSSTLRLHSEHGAPLCLGFAPSLTTPPRRGGGGGGGASALRLAERIVPRLDVERLAGVDGLGDLVTLLQIRDATRATLEQQLGVCFRFGLAVAADPQLWWDAFRYCRDALGHEHGLVGLVGPNAAVALPVAGGRVVSSRDALRLGVSLPCVLGVHRRRPLGSGKTPVLAPPASAVASFEALVLWERAMVRAFGITFSKHDAERLPAATFGAELLVAVAGARQVECPSPSHPDSSLYNRRK